MQYNKSWGSGVWFGTAIAATPPHAFTWGNWPHLSELPSPADCVTRLGGVPTPHVKASENKKVYMTRLRGEGRGTEEEWFCAACKFSWYCKYCCFIYIFFIYNALTISWYGTHNRARLQIKCALGGDDSPQHRHWSTLIDKCVGSFKSPDRTSRDKTNSLMSLSTDGVAKEGRLKVQPSTRRGIEPRTFCLAVRDLTNCANLAQTDSVGNLICMWHIRWSLARGWENLFMFGRELDRIKGPCMWGIITVWFCLMANAPYFPGVEGWGFTLTGA